MRALCMSTPHLSIRKEVGNSARLCLITGQYLAIQQVFLQPLKIVGPDFLAASKIVSFRQT